jgi:hypothetical protein
MGYVYKTKQVGIPFMYIYIYIYRERERERERDAQKVLVGKPEVTRQLGRPRRRWVDNIKMNLQEVGGGWGTGWNGLRIGTGGGHL